MLQTILRKITIYSVIGALISCGSESIKIQVYTGDLASNVTILHVMAILDGQPAMQGMDFASQSSNFLFTIELPAGDICPGQLAIDVVGLTDSRAIASSGHTDIQLCQKASNGNPEYYSAVWLKPNSFTSATFPAGSGPESIVVGDFNSDKNLDMIVANADGNNLGMLLGDGTGRFILKSLFPVENLFLTLVSGDFNRDGKLDLAAGGSGISIFLGNGMGGFSAPIKYAVDHGAYDLKAVELNMDGKLDLVFADGLNNVNVLLGDGMGNFGALKAFPVGRNILSVAAGDFNADGKPDLVAMDAPNNRVVVLIGDGMGSFIIANSYPVGDGPTVVSVVDINNDKKLDIVLATYHDGISVLLGKGAGLFDSVTNYFKDPYISIAVGDFDADGLPDVAAGVNENTAGSVNVLFSDAKGKFKFATNSIVGDYPKSISIGDFNGDGKFDLAVANRHDHNINVLLNKIQ